MELVVFVVLVVAAGALIYYNRSARSLDINQDGKVDAADAVQAVVNAAEGAKQTAKKAAVKAKTATRSSSKKPSTKSSATKKSRTPRK